MSGDVNIEKLTAELDRLSKGGSEDYSGTWRKREGGSDPWAVRQEAAQRAMAPKNAPNSFDQIEAAWERVKVLPGVDSEDLVAQMADPDFESYQHLPPAERLETLARLRARAGPYTRATRRPP